MKATAFPTVNVPPDAWNDPAAPWNQNSRYEPCICCGEIYDTEDMHPAGRGVWVCDDSLCLDDARIRRGE